MDIQSIIEFVEKYGLAVIAVLAFIEYLNIPGFPGGFVMPAAGVIVRLGYAPFMKTMIVLSAAAMLSEMTVYGVSYIFADTVKKICEKYEKTAGLYKKTVDIIDRRGAVGLFTARLIPGVRTFISIPAGLMKMRLRDYIPVSVVGNTVFVAINMVLGYFFTSFFV